MSKPAPACGQTPCFPRTPTFGSRPTSVFGECGSLKQGKTTWRKTTLGSAPVGRPLVSPGSRSLSLSFHVLAGELMCWTKVGRSCQNCFPISWPRTTARAVSARLPEDNLIHGSPMRPIASFCAQSCKMRKLCGFKPLSLWSFVNRSNGKLIN